jgi:glycosyltransferase involved in cell wall biosynthesis
MAKRECVTAIIPVRNGAKYLSDFIPNILDTCDEQDEIIFIEDHSTDETREMLKTYSSKFGNIKVIYAEKEGLVNALNQGIKEASHDWLARFDCDDNYVGTRIDLQIALIDKDVVCIFSDYRIRGSEGQDLGLVPSPVDPLPTKISLVSNLRTPHPVAMLRKETVLQVGGYRESDFPAEDLSLWLRLSEVGDLVTVPQELLTYSLQKNSITATRYEESKKKAHSLYLASSKKSQDITSAISNFEVQRTKYKHLSLSRERAFLHYLDIYLSMRYLGFKRFDQIHFLVRYFHLEYLPAIYFLGTEARKRRRYRRFNQAKNFST